MQNTAGSTPRVEVQVFIENLQTQVRSGGLRPETRQQLQEALEARDVAARQVQELHQKETFVRQVIDASPNLVFVKDETGKLIMVNQAMADFYGRSVEELAERLNCELLSNPDDCAQYARVDQHVLQTMQRVTVEETHQCPDGRTLWFLTTKTPIRLPDGRIGVMGVAVDISERKHAEEQHRQLADRLRMQIERMPIGCITNDRDFLITGWNPAAERIFGYTAEEVLGKHPYDVYVSASAQPLVDERRRRMEHGDMQANGINENVTKDGRTIVCQWTNTPLFDARGQYTGRIAMVQDVTERVHAQEALRQAKEAAEAANRSKDQFLAMLSHELRTPLTPVVMLASSLEMDPALPQSVRNDMSTIRRNVEVQARIVDDLLDLSRFTSGKLNLQLRPVDIHEQLRAVAGIWHNSLMHKRLELHWDLQAQEHWVNGDEARVQQVFWNLIGNAIKFTSEGGTIDLRSANDSPGKLVVEVRDTGAGIKPELRARIFSAFEQGEEGRGKGGLGLGLAICKAIVGLHHGTISAHSEGEGRGSTFRVELPTTSEWQAAAAEPAMTQPQSPLRILLVEDHEDTGRILRRLLEAEGHVVEHVTSGRAALDAAASQGFDLLLCDLGLPDISGLNVMRQLSDQYHLKGIAVSGYGTEADLQRSSEAGFSAHVTKPINMKELERAITHVLGRR